MALDPDNIRVDLLRIKRKLYLSYPEGSKERHDFLFATKLSELEYLTKLVNPSLAETTFEEYAKVKRLEVVNILMSLGLGASLSMMLYGFHTLHPTNIFYAFYLFPIFFGIGFALSHAYHLIEYRRKFQPFKNEYDILRLKIEKLMQELKDLAK